MVRPDIGTTKKRVSNFFQIWFSLASAFVFLLPENVRPCLKLTYVSKRLILSSPVLHVGDLWLHFVQTRTNYVVPSWSILGTPASRNQSPVVPFFIPLTLLCTNYSHAFLLITEDEGVGGGNIWFKNGYLPSSSQILMCNIS